MTTPHVENPRGMDYKGRLEWRPMRCAHGLSVWTQGPFGRRFAMVRRDSDGLRVTSKTTLFPIKEKRLRMLYQEFDNLVGPTLGGFMNTIDPRVASPEELARLRAYTKELDALIIRHLAMKNTG